MWTCQKCRAEIADDAKEFCFECMTPRKLQHKNSEEDNSSDNVVIQEARSNLIEQPDIHPYYYIFLIISWILIFVSVVFTINGLSTLYDNSYKAQVVGGDAYNFIIYATRGTAFICAGIVSSVIGLTFAVFASISKYSKKI